MDFLDSATKPFTIHHPIPKKKQITVIMIIVIAIVKLMITQVMIQIGKTNKFYQHKFKRNQIATNLIY